MKIICETGLIITSDDIDIINENMKAYYEENFFEKREYKNADEFFENYLHCELISGHNGRAVDIFTGIPKYIDIFRLDELLYFYIVPLDKKASLVKRVYTDSTEIIMEVKSKLFHIKRFLPKNFNFEERLARIEIAIEEIPLPIPTIDEEWQKLTKT